MNVRIEPRWTFTEVRRAAVALSRAVERRAPSLATSKWWKEERHGVFLDYNQNAKDRTTCSAYSVRPLPDARVSAPLHWHEVADCNPADFTLFTMPERFAKGGDPHADMDAAAGSLEKLLELADKDEAAGFGDAPWPPHFRKAKGEPSRVMPSRAKPAVKTLAAKKSPAKKSQVKKPRVKMPLITVANSPDKKLALAGLERWKEKYPEAAALLAVDDVPLIRCEVGHQLGPASESTFVMFQKRFGRRRKLLTPMTIRHANSGSDGGERNDNPNRQF